MAKNTVRATPAARRLAKKLDLDLFAIKGTGVNGRIHKDDVELFKEKTVVKISPLAKVMAEQNGIQWKKLKGSGIHGKIMKADILEVLHKTKTDAATGTELKTKTADGITSDDYGKIEVIPMTAMRKVISKRMLESHTTAPTFILNYDVDMTEILALRKKVMEPILAATGKKITITDIISLAVIKTLLKHKYVNASLSGDGQTITFHDYVNLAMAVGFDEGLLTPVIYNAEKMSLSELVVALKDVTTRALEMKLAPSELKDSTFTISNLGMFGVSSFSAIINQPNSAILAVSSTVEKPVVIDGEITVRPMMTMSLTIDHRVIDGLTGAKFMKDLKAVLENPITMMI